MGKENGFVISVSDKVIGMPEQKNNYDFSVGSKMKRGSCPEIFDNNGGDSKAGNAGVNDNFAYGPVTFGGGQ